MSILSLAAKSRVDAKFNDDLVAGHDDEKDLKGKQEDG